MMRIVDADAALSHAMSGDQVFVHGAAATPDTAPRGAVQASPRSFLSRRRPHAHGRPGPSPRPRDGGPLAPPCALHWRECASCHPGRARRVHSGVLVGYPPPFSATGDSDRRRARQRITSRCAWFLFARHVGRCGAPAVQCARTVIAQINPRMPRTHGDGFLHVSRINWGVEVDQPPYAKALPAITDVERRIGAFVADLVPDEATLQLGIGAIPSAIASSLHGKRDLGIHTEMLTDAVLDLVEQGVITGAKKDVNRGKIVSSFVLGYRAPLPFHERQPSRGDALLRLHQRRGRHSPLPPNGIHQLRYRDRSDRTSLR